MKSLKFSIFSLLAVTFIFVSCGSDSQTETNTDAAVNSENAALSSDAMAAGSTVNADNSQIQAPSGPTTSLTITNGTEFDYGTIDAGQKVTHKFKFKNTGSEPLIISNCKGSCGCTVPKCPTEPIAPGQEGEIPVEFDSKGKNGPDSKTVTITANTNPAQTLLTIKGNVIGQAPPAQ
jgi:hypothetical protein